MDTCYPVGIAQGADRSKVGAEPDLQFPGILNVGNTCYLASTTQMLVTALPEIPNPPGAPALIQGFAGMVQRLQMLVGCADRRTAVDPSDLKRAVGSLSGDTRAFLGDDQMDAHEFLGVVLSGLAEMMDGLPQLEMRIETTLTCVACHTAG
jgi:uncharacterized UBP type Zn finger protein